MEPIFTIEYSEYCVAEELSKLLYIPKQFNPSIFVPTSRQEKGIDLILYRRDDEACRNFTTTIQVKSSRIWRMDDKTAAKNNNCEFALWYSKFIPSPRADFFILTAQYPYLSNNDHIAQGKRSSPKSNIHWKSLFLVFAQQEMKHFLSRIKNKSGNTDHWFGIVFNNTKEIYTQRGFYKENGDFLFEPLDQYILSRKNPHAIQKLQKSLMPSS